MKIVIPQPETEKTIDFDKLPNDGIIVLHLDSRFWILVNNGTHFGFMYADTMNSNTKPHLYHKAVLKSESVKEAIKLADEKGGSVQYFNSIQEFAKYASK